MSSLLNLSSDDDGGEENPIASVWATMKEVFGFLAQHPQLMGIGLIGLGTFIKRTRQPSRVVQQRIARTQPGTQYTGPVTYWDTVDVTLPELPGLDIVVIPLGSAGQLASSIASGTIVSGVWGLFTALFPNVIAAANKVTVDLTFGDLLIAGGAAALLGPALGSLIKL